MVLKMYAIKDRLNDYAFPIPFPNEDQAIRYFKDQCTGGNQWMTRNREDFSIYYVGIFDSITGTIEQDEIKKIIDGADYPTE